MGGAYDETANKENVGKCVPSFYMQTFVCPSDRQMKF
jgi:hypothetical protein